MRSFVLLSLILVLALASLAARGYQASPPPLTLEAYWKLVEDTRQAIVSLEAVSKAEDIRAELDRQIGRAHV